MNKIIALFRTIPMLSMISLMKDWKSFVRFHYLHAAYESGLIEACEKPVSKSELMIKLSVKRPDLLDAIINLALSLKELSLKNERYILKGKRSKMLLGEKGDKFAAWIQAHVNYYNSAYCHFNERLKGSPDGDYLEVHGEFIARASKMLDPFMNFYIESNLNSDVKIKLLEAGCGSGIYLKKACEVNPKLFGIAIDYNKAVVQQAKNNIEKWGINNSFNAQYGDLFDLGEKFENEFDIVTMYSLLYYFPVNKRLELLKKVKTYLKKDGKLILVSTEQGKRPGIGSANLDLINRSADGCYEVPEYGEIEKLLNAAGFVVEKKESIFPGDTLYGYIAQKK
jgi:ubiquinone/menaquinone biosynthesis C-methylase UbiE